MNGEVSIDPGILHEQGSHDARAINEDPLFRCCFGKVGTFLQQAAVEPEFVRQRRMTQVEHFGEARPRNADTVSRQSVPIFARQKDGLDKRRA